MLDKPKGNVLNTKTKPKTTETHSESNNNNDNNDHHETIVSQPQVPALTVSLIFIFEKMLERIFIGFPPILSPILFEFLAIWKKCVLDSKKILDEMCLG